MSQPPTSQTSFSAVDQPTTSTPDPTATQTELYTPVIEDFSPSPPKSTGPLSQIPNAASANAAIIAFAFFILASVSYWQKSASSALWVSGQAVFEHGQYWRLFSALFVHADFGHLLANMPLFLIFGWFLRAFFGLWVFPIATFLVGIASNLATIYFYPPTSHLIGASGMLYGMVALWLVLYVKFDIDHSPLMRLFRALAFSLAVLFPTTFEPSTSYLAHATGFAIGTVLGLALTPFLKVQDTRQQDVAATIA